MIASVSRPAVLLRMNSTGQPIIGCTTPLSPQRLMTSPPTMPPVPTARNSIGMNDRGSGLLCLNSLGTFHGGFFKMIFAVNLLSGAVLRWGHAGLKVEVAAELSRTTVAQ